MSHIYIQEPPTNGKVLLKTSLGDIDIELWSKEAPKACRNFVQLCMEGYYLNTVFHRVVKGFIAQGGDPTGTGTGGESIYGKPFKDEFHQRLKFNRRGLVAMANAGPHDNGSQFFFTLDKTEELQKKHTIFGKVTGNTIYNMIRFDDLQVDEDERPSDPPKIINTEVLSNPFDDIEPRTVKSAKTENEPKKVKSKSKATKNFKLLSFGEEAEENETELMSSEHKISSSHDLLDDPKLSEQPAVEFDEETNRAKPDKVAEDIRKKLKKNEEISEEAKEEKEKVKERRQEENEKKKKTQEIANEKKKIDEEKNEKKRQEQNEMKIEMLGERKTYLKRKKEDTLFKKKGGREAETLKLLESFSSKITSEDADSADEEDWMRHKLKFEEGEESKAKDANMKGDDWYSIYDPRNPLNKRRRENDKKATVRVDQSPSTKEECR